MILALWGFLSMVCQDVLMSLMVQAEARNRWALAGLLDCLGWLAQIATISVSVTTILTHGFSTETAVVVGAITIANFVGTAIGTKLGSNVIKEKQPLTLESTLSMKVISLAEARPGDAIVVDSKGFLPFLIKLAERIRWRRSKASHAAIIVSAEPDAQVIQMEWHGEQVALSHFTPGTYRIIQAPETITRERAVAFAKRRLGENYGVLTLFSILFNLFTPRVLRVDFRHDGTLICSALVARAWEHGGWTCPSDPFQVTPAQITEWGHQ